MRNAKIKNLSNEIIDTDVLVIGGGLAGCRAALRAKDFVQKVTLVDKAVVARSGANVWCHAMLAPMPEGALLSWMKNIVEYTEYLSDQECAEILCKEQGERVKELYSWGVPFQKDGEGKFITEPVRGHEFATSVLVDGRILMERVKEQLLSRGINLVERVMITDLLTSDGKYPTQGSVVGAVGFHTRTGKFITIKAKVVLISTGLFSSKSHASHVDNLTGDGQAMAFRIGAELADMEFSHWPTFTAFHRDRKSSTLSIGLIQFQNHGAWIVNERGERFFEKYLPDRMERGSHLGYLTLAMVKEIIEGRGPIYFDMRHFSPERIELMRRMMPITMTAMDEAGIDIGKERIEITPIINLFACVGAGGINININGETNIPGLFAAGVSGKLRVGVEVFASGAQAICNVFGYRNGENAGRAAQEVRKVELGPDQVERLKKVAFSPLNRKDGIKPDDIYYATNKMIVPWRYSVVKNEQRMKEALGEIERIESEDLTRIFAKDIHELVKANEAKNFVLLSKLFYISSLERKESRIMHYREEYPYRDDIDWLKLTLLKGDQEGVQVRFEDVPIDNYPIKLEKRERIPAPIKVSYEK